MEDSKGIMKKIVFIIPYFGKFNNYFPLFLNSCEKNREYCDWIIITDNNSNYLYPQNVQVIHLTFEEIQNKIKEKFEFQVSIEYPYKLCDYKPAYGYIFEDLISEYLYWGYCDTDLIWGDFSLLLNHINIEKYDKIFDLGHCTIYKNNKTNNRRFMKSINGEKRYKVVYQSVGNCSFDEEYNKSINNIFIKDNAKIYSKSYSANIYMKSSNFRLTHLQKDKYHYSIEKTKKAFFIWNDGRLMRYVLNGKKIDVEEYLYIHMQSRKMKVNVQMNCFLFKIIPNSFDELEIDIKKINTTNFRKVKLKHFNLHYIKLRSKNLWIKTMRKLKIRN